MHIQILPSSINEDRGRELRGLHAMLRLQASWSQIAEQADKSHGLDTIFSCACSTYRLSNHQHIRGDFFSRLSFRNCHHHFTSICKRNRHTSTIRRLGLYCM
ncbi:hypothetical protein RvY_15788 [Ramazzottius varieornatus]|uniref:Uncharacterized protein n=1 Tax=Ramazzottius varieornatus TaxID=947166 RepID=A0A1D1VXM5_RAMVA|nr:hypothetical protein RvY_15788 [Ramazzottius varieornatus]